MFLKNRIKKNERDIEMLENLIEETKRDLLKLLSNQAVT